MKHRQQKKSNITIIYTHTTRNHISLGAHQCVLYSVPLGPMRPWNWRPMRPWNWRCHAGICCTNWMSDPGDLETSTRAFNTAYSCHNKNVSRRCCHDVESIVIFRNYKICYKELAVTVCKNMWSVVNSNASIQILPVCFASRPLPRDVHFCYGELVVF